MGTWPWGIPCRSAVLTQFRKTIPLKLYKALTACTVYLILAHSPLVSQEGAGTAVVLDLVPMGISEEETAVLTQIFRDRIEAIGRVDLIQESRMRQLLASEHTLPRWCAEAWCAAEVGRLLQAGRAVAGFLETDGIWFRGLAMVVNPESEETIKRQAFAFRGEIESLPTEVEVLAYGLFDVTVPPELQQKHDAVIKHSEDLQGITAARQRLKAVIRSAIFPGWGQLYLGKWLPGLGLVATQLALGGGMFSQYSAYRTAFDETTRFYDLYKQETNVELILEHKNNARRTFKEAELAIQYRKALTNAAVVVWLWNIYHAYKSVKIPDTAESKFPLFRLYFKSRRGSNEMGVAVALD